MTPLVAATARELDWSWQPAIVLPLVAAALLYAAGVQSLWSHGRRRGIRPWEAAAFGAGSLIVATALLSPLHAMSEQLFSAHMVQHELLMAAAAPLLVLGRPALATLWGLPSAARRTVGATVRSPAWTVFWRAISRPFDAWLIHGLVIWGWHIPFLFQAALRSDIVHAMQHLSFIGSALLFWWAIFHPPRRASLGLSIIYLFTTAVHTAVLGALMTFARAPWYPEYASGAAAWGLSPLEDQQIAGMVMWIPASLVYLVAALAIVRRWLRDSEWHVAREERATAS